MENKFKVKPNVFRIMHPTQGGPFDVVSAQVYFDLKSALESANAEIERLNEHLIQMLSTENDKIKKLREALKEISEYSPHPNEDFINTKRLQSVGKIAREALEKLK